MLIGLCKIGSDAWGPLASPGFGKFLEIQLQRGQVVGASLRKYLLEKTRVVRQAANEGNFHVFYSLLAGASADTRRQLHLEGVDKFGFIRPGYGTFRLTFHRFDRFELDLRGHTRVRGAAFSWLRLKSADMVLL